MIRDAHSFRQYGDSFYKERSLEERNIAAENKKNQSWFLPGFCEPCYKETRFLVDWAYSDGVIPNYRERLVCVSCGLNNRQRFMANYIKQICHDNQSVTDIYLYEQVTNFYKYLKTELTNINIIGSEYLGFNIKGGEIINNIRHEDALNLSFNESSFDMIVSNDVYEHVPDIEKALRESHRVLKKRGKLLFTIPFYPSKNETTQRAAIKNGEISHILPAQYHGNPLSSAGSLVFYNFGWDILAQCKIAGFRDAFMIAYYDMSLGYIGGGGQFIFCAEK